MSRKHNWTLDDTKTVRGTVCNARSAEKILKSSTPAPSTRNSSVAEESALPAGYDSQHMKKYLESVIALARENGKRLSVAALQKLARKEIKHG